MGQLPTLLNTFMQAFEDSYPKVSCKWSQIIIRHVHLCASTVLTSIQAHIRISHRCCMLITFSLPNAHQCA